MARLVIAGTGAVRTPRASRALPSAIFPAGNRSIRFPAAEALLVCCLLLCAALFQRMAFAEPVPGGRWQWAPAAGEDAARAWTSAPGRPGLALTVTFPAEQRCYTANLRVTDDDRPVLSTDQVTVTAGAEQFVLSVSGLSGVYDAPPPVFHALKRAQTVRLATADAEYVFSLDGSAAAINSVWKACEDGLGAAQPSDPDTPEPAAPPDQTTGVAGAPTDPMPERASGEPPAPGAFLMRRVLPVVVLMFAVGNAFLLLAVIAKRLSLPALPKPPAGKWARGAALVGAIGWAVVPVIFFAAYGVSGAALAVAGYLLAGLLIAAVMKPLVAQYATKRLIDQLRQLRSRRRGGSRGSRQIVDGYRRIARRQGVAPTEKTTDAEILRLFERVGSAFKSVAYQRREYLQASRVNYIVWTFLQAYEAMGRDAFDHHLQAELSKYREAGLATTYRNDLKF